MEIDEAEEILEVKCGEAREKIRDSYRALAMLYHPDRLVELPPAARREGERRMRMLNEALDLLTAKHPEEPAVGQATAQSPKSNDRQPGHAGDPTEHQSQPPSAQNTPVHRNYGPTNSAAVTTEGTSHTKKYVSMFLALATVVGIVGFAATKSHKTEPEASVYPAYSAPNTTRPIVLPKFDGEDVDMNDQPTDEFWLPSGYVVNPDRNKNLAYKFTGECGDTGGTYCWGLAVISRKGCSSKLVVSGLITGNSAEPVSQEFQFAKDVTPGVALSLRPLQELRVDFTTYDSDGTFAVTSLKCVRARDVLRDLFS